MIHKTDEILTNFDEFENIISITYPKNEVIKGIMVFMTRITDDYFNHEYIEINKKKYIFNKKIKYENNIKISESLNEEEIFNKIGFEEFKNNIIIKCKTEKDFKYAKSVLVYTIKNDREKEYNLNIELKRWEKSKNS